MSLLIWLPLLGTLENKGTVLNITINGHSSSVDTTHGKLSLSCLHFTRADTPTDYISLPAQLTASSQFTYACWFNTASIALNQCLFSLCSVGDSSGYSIFYMGASTNANADKLRFDDGAGLYSDGKISSANKWYHLAFVRTATQKLIYINGNLSGSGAINTPTNVNSNYILIGGSLGNAAGSSPTDNGLNGYLQDVRLYDNALSAAEIKNLAKGLMVHYKLDDSPKNNENLLKYTLNPSTTAAYRIRLPNLASNTAGRGSCSVAEHGFRWTVGSSPNWAYFSFGATSNGSGTMHGLIPGETYTFSGDCTWKVLSSSTGMSNTSNYYVRAILAYDTGGGSYNSSSLTKNIGKVTLADKGTVMSGRCEFTFKIPASSVRIYLMVRCSAATASHYAQGDYIEMRNMKLEHNNHATSYSPSLFDLGYTPSTTTFIDSSGYDNTGIINGSISKILYNGDARFRSVAQVKDNVSNFSSTRAIGTSESAFSFNLWYKASEYLDAGLILRHKLNSNLLFNFGCTGANDASSHLFNVFRSGTNYITYRNFEIPIDEWHMWTGTYDGTTVKLYKDGVLLGSATSLKNYSSTYTDGNTFLGSTSIKSMQGYASDIRMYATVLDAATIKEFYDTALKIGNYGDVHSYEFVEDNNTVDLHKNGLLVLSEIIEDNTLTNTKLIGTTWYAPEFIES